MERNQRALRAAEWALDPDAWQVVRAIVILKQGLWEAGGAVGFSNRMAAAAVALDRLRRGLGGLAELWGFTVPQRPVTPTEAPVSGALRVADKVANVS